MVTSELTHYHYLVANLQRDVLLALFDIFTSPTCESLYGSIKAAVLEILLNQYVKLLTAPFPAYEPLSSHALAGGVQQNTSPLRYGETLEMLQTAWGKCRRALNAHTTLIAVEQHTTRRIFVLDDRAVGVRHLQHTTLQFNALTGTMSATVNPRRDAHNTAAGQNIARRTSSLRRCRTVTLLELSSNNLCFTSAPTSFISFEC